MRRLAPAVVVLSACAAAPPPPPPPACAVIAPQRDAGLPDDTVWGFADLHAHPAIEVAFAGALVWGTALDEAPVDAQLLPRIKPCPVETHTDPGAGPLDRNIGSKLFPQLSSVAHFAHAPVGTLGLRPADAWPDARDVIHQQMNVSSIRRAYEGGLRLMFASTTDSQVLAALLTRVNFVNAFQPLADADYASAKRQLELIVQLAAASSPWMEIARTPHDARRIINAGKLALVLSLEMDGLTPDQVSRLGQDYGARHFFPIHLIDNAFGGTAANADLYNAASAAVSSLYRLDGAPFRYLDVVPTLDYSPHVGRPLTIATLTPAPLYVDLAEAPFATFESLCYEPLQGCLGTTAAATTFTTFGQQNLRGLCTEKDECLDGGRPGAAQILGLMDAGWLIDISHMGARSAAETVALRDDVPLIASHGDVAHLCWGHPNELPCTDSTDGREVYAERQLDADQARAVVDRNGELGLGLGVGNFYTRPLVIARGAPLLTLDGAGSVVCVARPGDAGTVESGCEAATDFSSAALSAPAYGLLVETTGPHHDITAGYNAHRFVRISLRDAVDAGHFQRRELLEPLDCETGAGGADVCSANVSLGTRQAAVALPGSFCTPASCSGTSCTAEPYTVDDIDSVTLEWLFLKCTTDGCEGTPGSGDRQCASTLKDAQGMIWELNSAAATVQSSSTLPLVVAGPRDAPALATLDGNNAGSFTLYQRRDRVAGPPVAASGHLLKVSMIAGSAGGNVLKGSNPQSFGANLCIKVRQRAGGVCQGASRPDAGARECPEGWVPFNRRGEWDNGVELYTFVRWQGDEADVCGLDVALVEVDPAAPPFSIDEVRIEAAEDPVGHWIRRYAEVSRQVARHRLGVLALGTDFNGLNGMIDLSEQAVPPGARRPSACAAGEDPAPLIAPMRFRDANGPSDAGVLIEERGLATYGLLQDFVAVVDAYPGCGHDVRDSLMLSAEATLRAWEQLNGEPARPPLPLAAFDCGDGGSP